MSDRHKLHYIKAKISLEIEGSEAVSSWTFIMLFLNGIEPHHDVI